MTNKTIIETYYKKSQAVQFENNYTSSIVGTKVLGTCDFAELYGENTRKIIFNNTNIQTITYPSIYNVIENITIQFNDGSAIFASNTYISNNEYYEVGSKIIIPTTSCIGKFIGKSGYIVIDVEKDIRKITIVLE